MEYGLIFLLHAMKMYDDNVPMYFRKKWDGHFLF